MFLSTFPSGRSIFSYFSFWLYFFSYFSFCRYFFSYFSYYFSFWRRQLRYDGGNLGLDFRPKACSYAQVHHPSVIIKDCSMTEITFLSVSLEFESSCVRNVNHLAFQAGCLSVSSMVACVSTAVLLYKTVRALGEWLMAYQHPRDCKIFGRTAAHLVACRLRRLPSTVPADDTRGCSRLTTLVSTFRLINCGSFLLSSLTGHTESW